MFAIVLSILVCSYFLVVWSYFKWTNRCFNNLAAKMKGPPAYPLIGSTFIISGSPTQTMDKIIKISKDYGSEPFKIWFGPFFSVWISKPEDVQIILSNSKALKKPKIYTFLKFFGEGLVTAPVNKWKKHRRIINPAFNSRLLQQFFSSFNEKNGTLINNLKEKLDKTIVFDVFDYLYPTTLNIICQTAMGYNLNTQSEIKTEFVNNLMKLQEVYIKRIRSPWLYPNIINAMYDWLSGVRKIDESVFKFSLQVIMEKKQAFANKVKNVDDQEENHLKIFLEILLELDEAGANFSIKDLADEVLTMIVTGSETTALTSSFCLLMLAIHQDVQDKVYDEIYNALGDSDEPISIEDVNKLSYLEQVLMEALRLYPLVPLIIRELEDDVKIFSADLVLPKGTMVVLNVYGTHTSSELYSDPLAFNPDNFNRENISKRHKYSYLPFSGGPRNCIGSKYAMLSMKALVCKFLQNFSVHTDIKMSDIRLSFKISLNSAIGYPVTIRSRVRRPTFRQEPTEDRSAGV